MYSNFKKNNNNSSVICEREGDEQSFQTKRLSLKKKKRKK